LLAVAGRLGRARVEQALFGDQRPSNDAADEPFPTLPLCTCSCSSIVISRGSWSGKSTGRRIRKDTATAASANCISTGAASRMWLLRQEHPPGEKGFIDWAGATIPVHDAVTGEVWPASLFVMVLGASSYTYAEATRDQQLTSWLSSHMHAFEYFGGVPRLLVPDNPRTGVSRACRYDPDLNPTYQELALHYGVGVVPARPYRPRDKAKVEVGVQVVERWIIAALRHRKFFRLEDVNRAVRELLERLNQRPFRKREGSRASVFAALESSALRPLPAERFDMSQWSRARVNIDYPSPSRATSTACRTRWSRNGWKSAPRRQPWRFFIKGSAWLRISAVAHAAKPSPRTSTGRRVTKHIWSGHPRAW